MLKGMTVFIMNTRPKLLYDREKEKVKQLKEKLQKLKHKYTEKIAKY